MKIFRYWIFCLLIVCSVAYAADKYFWQAVVFKSTVDIDGATTLNGTLDTALTTAGPTIVNGSGVLSSEAQLAITRGGTGQSTNTLAFDALAPGSVTAGDVIYYNGTNWVKLDGCSDGELFKYSSNVPTCSADNTGSGLTVTSINSSDSPYTLTTSTDTLVVDGTSDDITINLYAVAGNSGENVEIKRIDKNFYDFTTFTDANVNTGTENINDVAHGLPDLKKVVLTTTGTLPGGLSLATNYWVIYVDADNYMLANSRANAVADSAVDITSAAGGGTHTATPQVTSVTIDGNGSETIDQVTTVKLMTKNEVNKLVTNATEWFITNRTHNTAWYNFNITNYTGLTAAPTIDLARWKRNDDNTILVQFRAAMTSRDASEFQINLPLGFTHDTSGVAGAIILGSYSAGGASAADLHVLATEGDTFFNFTTSDVVAQGATAQIAASVSFSFTVVVPVNELLRY